MTFNGLLSDCHFSIQCLGRKMQNQFWEILSGGHLTSWELGWERGQVPWLYLCSWGGRRGILLSALGVAGGSHGLCVSAPRWERQCSLGRVVWNRAACEHGPPSLSCPWRLVFQHSPFQGPGRGYSQELNHKPNQRLNTTYNEIHETAFTSLLSLVPRYWLAVREQTGALGSPGVVCPVSEAGRLILEALFSCCWMTPGPHLYKRQEPWYILNLWEDLLASSWHKAVFLALTVSGTRSDSLLNWRYLWEHPFWPPQLAWSFLCLFVKWKWVCAS